VRQVCHLQELDVKSLWQHVSALKGHLQGSGTKNIKGIYRVVIGI